MRGILWDGKKILRCLEMKTPQKPADFENGLKGLIKKLAFGEKIKGIGIGTAGVVSGTILKSSRNIPKIKNFDFANLRDGIPHFGLRVDNDARAFARGEYVLGAGNRFKSAFFLTIGTGIGRAYGKNGKIMKIKKLEYAEQWEREYQKIRDGENDAKLAEFLGKHLINLIKPYNPQAIIIGGGVAMKRKNLFEKLKNALKKNGVVLPVLKSSLGKYSAALGAVLLFRP